MIDTTATARLDRERKDRLVAIKAPVEAEEHHVEGVEAAQAEIRAGRGIPHAEVMAEIDRIIAAAENPA